MPAITVVVTFYSRGGATETLAHAGAVGAVQQRAAIRLRRVAEPDPEGLFARRPESADALRRMHKEYVEPREADILAADALIIASPADVDASAPEWRSYVALLEQLHASGKLAGKVAAAIPTGASTASFAALLRRLQLSSPSLPEGKASVDDAVGVGRALVSLAQSLRT